MTPRISPSRLPIYRACRRQWYLKEVLQISTYEEEPGYFKFGTEAHAVAEALLLGAQAQHGGWAYEVGKAFAELTDELLDELGGAESDFRVEIGDGHYQGRMDAWGWRKGRAVIVDHKTSAAPASAVKTADQMKADSQVTLYAYGLMHMLREQGHEIDGCWAHWHWLPSKRRADPLDALEVSEVWITYGAARAAAERACETGLEMMELARSEDIPLPYFREEGDSMELRCAGLTKNTYTCEYIGRCEDMGLLSKLQESKTNLEKASDAAKEAETVATKAGERLAKAVKPATVNPDPADRPVQTNAVMDALQEARDALGPAATLGECAAWITGRYGA